MVLTSLGRDQKKNIFVFQIAIFHARSQRVLLKPVADIKINNWNSAYLFFSWVVMHRGIMVSSDIKSSLLVAKPSSIRLIKRKMANESTKALQRLKISWNRIYLAEEKKTCFSLTIKRGEGWR